MELTFWTPSWEMKRNSAKEIINKRLLREEEDQESAMY